MSTNDEIIRPTHTYTGMRVTEPKKIWEDRDPIEVEETRVFVDGNPLPMSALARAKSLAGFEWGYGGSGPAALAHSILTYEVGGVLANQFYQDFKWHIISKLGRDPADGWTIISDDIRGWLKDAQGVDVDDLDMVRVSRVELESARLQVERLVFALDEAAQAHPDAYNLTLFNHSEAARTALETLIKDAGLPEDAGKPVEEPTA